MTGWYGRIMAAILMLQYSIISAAVSEEEAQCLLAYLEKAEPQVTVGQIKSTCADELVAANGSREEAIGSERQSVVDIRRKADFESRASQFAISAYRANYIMYTYNSSPNERPFEVEPEDFFDEEELKFQVSFQMPVATGMFGGDTDLIFAYTSVAWWQALNDDISNPFRETNYEPEIFFRNHKEHEFGAVTLVDWQVGLNHQSNGRSQPTSRGWDRLIAGTSFQLNDDLVLGLRAWHILDAQDDNSDIERYLGYGDLGLGWVPNRNTFTAMFRPASEGSALQLTWSYPISDYLRVYAQYWNGYGESLIDYDIRTKRFGIGIALSDIIAR